MTACCTWWSAHVTACCTWWSAHVTACCAWWSAHVTACCAKMSEVTFRNLRVTEYLLQVIIFLVMFVSLSVITPIVLTILR